MFVIRATVLAVVIAIYGVALSRSESTDALGAGLLAFLLLTAITFVWGLVDGSRRGFKSAVLLWLPTSVVAGVAVPLVLSLTGSTGEGIGTSVRDSTIFFAVMLFMPALIGLGIGSLVHRMRGSQAEVGTEGAALPVK